LSDKSQADIAEETSILEGFKVTRTLIRIANSTDAKDWKTLRAQFADEILVDFGHVKTPQLIRADDLVAWTKQTYGHMTTQQMVTNHEVQISGETAKVVSYGCLLYRQIVTTGEDFWCLYCRYDHDLLRTEEGWKVVGIKVTPTLQHGNSALVRQAFADFQSWLRAHS
jgi:hypothetical protein